MRKILLLGISASGDNYGKPFIFSNIPDPIDDKYPLSYARDILGEDPADLSVVYSSIDDNPEQMTHFRSLTKALKHIEILVSSNTIFKEGDIEVHCFRVSKGNYSLRKFTDNSPTPIPNNYSFITGLEPFTIESIKRGDEYNYFNIDISGPNEKPILTLSYITPAETESIKIINDPDIETPYIKQLNSNSVAELVDTINSSPFGLYINAKQKIYTNRLTVPYTDNFRMPDDPKSYRIETINYITATFREKFLLNEFKLSHSLEQTPRLINWATGVVRQTVTIKDNSEFSYLDVDFVLQKGKTPRVVSDPDNVLISIDYPSLVVRPNSEGKEIIIEFDVILYQDTKKIESKHSIYSLTNKDFVIPAINYNTTDIEVDIEYLHDITPPYIPNLGHEGKGIVTDLSNWPDRVKQAIEIGYSPLYWVDRIDSSFMENLKKDYLDGLDILRYKPIYLELLNEVICSRDFIQNGFNYSDVINNYIYDHGYTPFTCREINCMLIANTFPEFSITYQLEAKPPLIILNNFSNIKEITLGYNYYLNSGRNNGLFQNGEDKYVMSHSEYKQEIINTFLEYNLTNHILSAYIDDVIMLGAYIDNTELVSQKLVNKYEIENDLILSDTSGYFYYINDISYIDNFSAKVISSNIPSIVPVTSITGNIVRFNIPNTGDVITDFETFAGQKSFPLIIDIEFIKRTEENVRYDEIITSVFDNKIWPTDTIARDVLSTEFKMSSKPFIEEASLDINEDFEKHLNKTFSNPVTLLKYSHMNITIANAQTETQYDSGTIIDYIEPAILSSITEEYCLKTMSGKVGINYTNIFDSKIMTSHKYVLKQDFITAAESRGIEVYSSSGEDMYTVCICSNNLHINNVLKYNKYKMIFRQILRLYREVCDDSIGEIGPNPNEFADTMSDLIDSNYGTILSHLSIKYDKYKEGVYYFDLNITFNKTSMSVSTPLMVVI